MKYLNIKLYFILIFISLICNILCAQHDNYYRLEQQDNTLYKNSHTGKGIKYIFPQENKVVFYKDIRLIWTNYVSEKNQRLQISNDRNFNSLVVDTVIHISSFTIQELNKHNSYYWRVWDLSKPEAISNPSFFKTTALLIDESQKLDHVDIIPTWLDNMEVIYVDNPMMIRYEIKIYDEKQNLMVQKSSNLEKFAFETESWPEGAYQLMLSISKNESLSKTFIKG